MKTILIILICLVAPIVAYAIYAFSMAIYRYYTDVAYRSRMDKRKSAIVRSKRFQKVNQTKSNQSIFADDSETMKAALGEY